MRATPPYPQRVFMQQRPAKPRKQHADVLPDELLGPSMEPRLRSRGSLTPLNQHGAELGPSMEPRLRSRGSKSPAPNPSLDLLPSMEPRLRSRGSFWQWLTQGPGLLPSMEPRLRSGGSSGPAHRVAAYIILQWSRGCEAAEATACSRTNSAGHLQWSRGCEAAEASRHASPGCLVMFLQWSRGCEAAEACGGPLAAPCPARSFNGAAAAKPRKRASLARSGSLMPSMEPRKLVLAARARPRRSPFNGAAAAKPRKHFARPMRDLCPSPFKEPRPAKPRKLVVERPWMPK